MCKKEFPTPARSLKLCMDAINNVGVEYLSTDLFNPGNIGPDKAYAERVFAYELYHQLRLIEGHGEFNDLRISCEMNKKLGYFYSEPIRKLIDVKNYVIPDIILHDPVEVDQNQIVIEIKVGAPLGEEGVSVNPKDIMSDLHKLVFYTIPYTDDAPDGLNYSHGIFILVNRTIKDLCEDTKDGEQEALDDIRYTLKSYLNEKNNNPNRGEIHFWSLDEENHFSSNTVEEVIGFIEN